MNEFSKMTKEAENKLTPIDMFAAWYKENGKTAEPPKKNDEQYETLKQRYLQDPNSLSAVELTILGQYELDLKRKEEGKEKQSAVNEYMKPYNEAKKEDKEMISSNSEEYKQLARQMEELSKAFQELNNFND
ncbi:hypothetical protein ACQCVH_01895 [Bacillus infantis]|uniref:hypothetical protein n=1 Tax=Bacillus infantis TaxID=324767 RepID=UPI003CF700C6